MGSLQKQELVSFTTACFQQGCFLSTQGTKVLRDTSSPSSSRQHSSHRHVPAVYSARGRGCNTAEADGWRGCKWQQEAGSSMAGGHAQGTKGGVGEAEPMGLETRFFPKGCHIAGTPLVTLLKGA